MAITDSEDTPNELTSQVYPDWWAGIDHFTAYRSQANRARSGSEQRVSGGPRCWKAMEYVVDGLNQAGAINLMASLENRGRGPLLVPWWPDGLRLSTTMATVNSAQVEVTPLADWLAGGSNPKVLIGDQVRTVTGLVDRTLTLAALTGAVQYGAAIWVYPMRPCALDNPDDALTIIRHDSKRQRLRFVAF